MTWTPGHFLLSNEFCPPEQIQRALDRLRIAAKLPWLVLVPYSTTGPVRTLSFVSSQEGTSDLHATSARSTVESQLSPGPNRAISITHAVKSLQGPHEHPVTIISSGKQGLADGAIAYWLAAPQLKPSMVPGEDRERLLEMLAGTAIANSLRDGQIQNLIIEAVSGTSITGLRDGLRRLLELAQRVSGASGAAFYQFEPGQDGLVKEAWVGDPLDELPQLIRQTASTGVENSIYSAFRRSRTFLYPAPGDQNDGSEKFVSVPAPLSPFGGLGRNAGVLVVWKLDEHTISWFDTALVRNVALRIALLKSNASIELSAAQLVEVAGELASPARLQPSRRRGQLEDVPADVALAKNQLEQLAEHLYEATRSDSVTIRVLMPSPDSDTVVLRRFIAFPDDRLHMQHEQLVVPVARIQDFKKFKFNSANIHAAVVGEAHVHDAARSISEQVPRLRRLTPVGGTLPLSEIALPIRADGMLVGTLNLESAYSHAFSSQVGLIRAFAEMAGITVAMNRRENLRMIADRYSLVSKGVHQVSKFQRLIDMLPGENEEMRILLSEVAEEVRPRIRSTPDPPSDLPLASLIDEVRSDHPSQKIDVDPIQFHATIAGDHRVVVRAVLDEIFANLLRHSAATFMPSITTFPLQLTDNQYVVLVFRNQPIVNVTNKRLLRRYYRVPIQHREQSGHFHLGCFTAGELMRGIGGNLFADSAPSGLFETRLYVPARLEQ